MKPIWIVALVATAAAAGLAAWWSVRSWSAARDAETEASRKAQNAGSSPIPPERQPDRPSREDVHDLFEQLSGARTRGHAQLALKEMGAEALPALADALATTKGPARPVIVALLAGSGDRKYLPPVLALFDMPDEDAKLSGLSGVSRFNAVEEKGRLLRMLDDASLPTKVREVTADILARWKAREAIPILLTWIQPTTPEAESQNHRRLMQKGIAALGSLQAEEAVAPLRDLVLGPETSAHAHAAEALVSIGAPAMGAIEQIISTKDSTRVVRVLRALGHSNDPQAEDLLRPFLTDPDERLRRTAHDSFESLTKKRPK